MGALSELLIKIGVKSSVKQGMDEAAADVETGSNKMADSSDAGNKRMQQGAKDTAKETRSMGSTMLETVGSGAALSAGIYELYDSTDNLTNAQIAAERANLKLSKANEAVEKMQSELNDATTKYGADSPEAAAAALNLEQALQQQSVAAQNADMATGNVDDAMVSFVTGGITGVISAISGGAGLLKNFKDLAGSEGLVGLTGKLKGVGGSISELATGGISKLGGAFSSVGGVLKGLGATLMANPILIVAMAIALVVVLIITNWDKVKPYFEALWNAIKGIFEAAWNVIKSIINVAMTIIKGIIDVVWGAIQLYITTVMGIIKAVIDVVWGAIQTAISFYMGIIQAVINVVWGAIQLYINTVMGIIKAIIDVVWGAIQAAISFYMGLIQAIISTVWGVIQAVISTVMGVIQGIINGAMAAWNAIVNAAMAVLQTYIIGPFNTIRGFIQSVMDGISGIFRGAWDTIKGLTQGAVDFIMALIKPLLDTINGVGQSVNNLMSGKGDVIPGLHLFADGGVVDRPTLAMIGEAGEREYVIPESKMGSAMARNVSATWKLELHLHGLTDPEKAGDAVIRAIRRRGVPI